MVNGDNVVSKKFVDLFLSVSVISSFVLWISLEISGTKFLRFCPFKKVSGWYEYN